MPKPDRHRGSRLDHLLCADGLRDEVRVFALKRVVSEAIAERMTEANLSRMEMARRMRTSRSQLDRVLDPECTTVQLDTLLRAANAVGRKIRIRLE